MSSRLVACPAKPDVFNLQSPVAARSQLQIAPEIICTIMAAPSAYRDRQFLAVIGDEVESSVLTQ